MVDMYLMKAEKGMKRVLVITAPTKTGAKMVSSGQPT